MRHACRILGKLHIPLRRADCELVFEVSLEGFDEFPVLALRLEFDQHAPTLDGVSDGGFSVANNSHRHRNTSLPGRDCLWDDYFQRQRKGKHHATSRYTSPAYSRCNSRSTRDEYETD